MRQESRSRRSRNVVKAIFDPCETISHGSKMVFHGSKVVSHGSKEVSHGSKVVFHGTRIVSHGSHVSSHGTKVASHGSRTISHGTDRALSGTEPATRRNVGPFGREPRAHGPHRFAAHAPRSLPTPPSGVAGAASRCAGETPKTQRRLASCHPDSERGATRPHPFSEAWTIASSASCPTAIETGGVSCACHSRARHRTSRISQRIWH